MSNAMLPFNVTLMELSAARLRHLKPVTSLDIYEGATNNFHESGLYSISIFGRPGSDERDERFSFIDIKVPILHPIIFTRMMRLKQMYEGIVSGRSYAVWNPALQDFEAADPTVEGAQTGYHFFMSHWKEIKFHRNKSDTRNLRIDLIEKYKERAEIQTILVLPAGLRDVQVDPSGRTIEDEINAMYRRLLIISNTIPAGGDVTKTLDVPRWTLQRAFNDIYDVLNRMLTGKKGFIQARWGSRRIFNGTRNVITAMDTGAAELGSKTAPKITDTQVGLFQTMKGALPLACYYIRNGWIDQVFSAVGSKARLIDRKTLKAEDVQLDSTTFDAWTTVEGLEKLINSYFNTEIRNQPVVIEGRYLGLMVTTPDSFRMVGDIEEVPEEWRKQAGVNIHPMTYTELLYLSGYRQWNDLVVMITRYPITGLGSIYPSTVYVRTTVKSSVKRELGPDWEPMDEAHTALVYPEQDLDAAFIDTLILHGSRLAGLGADFDGDTASGNFVTTPQALDECRQYLRSAKALMDPRGGLTVSASIDTVDLVLRNLTSNID